MWMLLWKEWRQNRAIIISGIIAMLLMYFLFTFWGSSSFLRIVDKDTLFMLEWLTACVFSMLLGANMFASETGQGTYLQLAMLPVEHWKPWTAKFVVGILGTLLFSIFMRMSAPAAIKLPIASYESFYWLVTYWYTATTVAFFAIAFFVSTFTNQPIQALFGSILIGFMGSFTLGLFQGAFRYAPISSVLFIYRPALIFFLFSYLMWRYGELESGLNSRKYRLAALLLSIAASLIIIELLKIALGRVPIEFYRIRSR